MPNTKLGGNRWVPDIRPDKVEKFNEGEEEYKAVDAHPILNKILDAKAFFRTHASAVWYSLKDKKTVAEIIKSQQDEIAALQGEVSKLNAGKISFSTYSGTADYIEILKTNWDSVPENFSVGIVFSNGAMAIALIQKVTFKLGYGSVIMFSYMFNTPNFYRLNNGAWSSATLL